MHQNLKPSSLILAAYSSFHRPDQLKLVGLKFLSRSNLTVITPMLSNSQKSINTLPSYQYPTDDINYYCAPEIKTKNYDFRVDLFSIGGILYTLITGHPPPFPTPDMKFGNEWEVPYIQETGLEVSIFSFKIKKFF